MTDLQILVRQTSNPSMIKMQQRLHDEVIQLGKVAIEWREKCERIERDCLTASQETDEKIASLESEVEALKIQLAEVQKVIERDDLYSVVMGCARTYAYEYSKGDVRLINAAYVRLQNNLLIAIKMINP